MLQNLIQKQKMRECIKNTFPHKKLLKTIALEFCNTEIIRIDDNGKTKKYTVIETME